MVQGEGTKSNEQRIFWRVANSGNSGGAKLQIRMGTFYFYVATVHMYVEFIRCSGNDR